MTEEIFRQDAYLKRCEARVTSVDDAGIHLDRTVFYPMVFVALHLANNAHKIRPAAILLVSLAEVFRVEFTAFTTSYHFVSPSLSFTFTRQR